MKILVTAFDPFGGESVNPALEAVRLLPTEIGGAEIEKVEVPTSFSRAFETVIAAVNKYNPDVIVCVGQAGGRKSITPERKAVNLDDARIADNDGDMPKSHKIVDGGKDVYYSTLPIDEIVSALKGAGLPAEISNDAGTFVCNHLFYLVMELLATREKGIGGFVHVPFETSQVLNKAGAFALPLETIEKGLEIVLKTICSRMC